MDLFSDQKQKIILPNAELVYYPSFLNATEADSCFNLLKENSAWQHDDITVYGKTYKQPRLTALYGDTSKPYSYSNITMYPKPYTDTLKLIKTKIEAEVQTQFNTVLLNYYRDGNDSNGWHADNEKELGTNPIIASISLGEERPFHFKHRTLNERHKLILEHGSLLVMAGEMQHHWLHQIAKTKRLIGGRINLTFRQIKT